MHPETQLAIVAAFAGFLLKTFLGLCICWAISKVVVSPRRKFLVWFAFLAVSGGYWLWLILSFIPHTASEFPLRFIRTPPQELWRDGSCRNPGLIPSSSQNEFWVVYT